MKTTIISLKECFVTNFNNKTKLLVVIYGTNRKITNFLTSFERYEKTTGEDKSKDKHLIAGEIFRFI